MHHPSRNPVRMRASGLIACAAGSLCWLAATATADSILDFNYWIGNLQDGTTTAPASDNTADRPKDSETGREEAGFTASISPTATFLLGPSRIHDDPTILWPGFLSGLRGFEHFYEPVGNPIYFESPFNYTGLRFLYLHHDFPDQSQLGGGDLNVWALQVRLALTERLGFIATKDGYSDLNARILPNDEGWNDFAIGLKYALIVDRENDFVLTPGLRWEWVNGSRGVLQGGTHELSPFISVAKGFGQFHTLANVTGRIPTDLDRGNCILSWDLHLDYELDPQNLPGFAPVLEFHGLHYLSNGESMPLSVGGLDYTNLGSTDVAGSSVFWAGAGFRWKLSPHLSVGSTFEFPLCNASGDIMGNRVTVDLALNW